MSYIQSGGINSGRAYDTISRQHFDEDGKPISSAEYSRRLDEKGRRERAAAAAAAKKSSIDGGIGRRLLSCLKGS